MKYIWLIGENEGKTANNNSFYFWRYIVNRYDDVDAYFVLQKNEKTVSLYQTFSAKEKKNVVWRNSLKHCQLFFRADMLFVTLSFKDVQPQQILFKRYEPYLTQPLVYLQHGTLAMKKLGYKNFYANNSLFRFFYYNPNIPEKLTSVNGFRDYQLYDGEFHPRYMELVRRAQNVEKHDDLKIMWFMTWREYFGNNWDTKRFLLDIERVLTDKRLIDYLNRRNATIKICLHSKFSAEQMTRIHDAIKGISHLELVHPDQIDVMDELAQQDVLITDYSSVGFDFTLLNKPTILYQSDMKSYGEKRDFYCSKEDLAEVALHHANELVECLIQEKYGINPFFAKNMHLPKDMNYLLEGQHIERMYRYFLKTQQESVAFLGYDFSGIGGTVFATRALAEGLLEKGYAVRMFTCKQMDAWRFPAGAPMHPMYFHYKRTLKDKIKVKAIRNKKFYRHLLADPALSAMPPVSGLGMTYWMKNIHAKTVVSTRESLHFFLQEATSPMIKNKIYFFHTTAELVDELFPGCISKLQQLNLEKVVFVTKNNKIALEKRFGFNNYQKSCILGNSLDSSRSIERDAIKEVEEKQTYTFCSLLRITKERADDIERMLQFARYLKSHAIDNIKINVYGSGNYVDHLKYLIESDDVEQYLKYCGVAKDIRKVYEKHDGAIDFSKKQSFGMVYIEAILNGKMVYCRHNEGADDVLNGMPECFFDTDDELLNKLLHVTDQTFAKLADRYDKIAQRYSRRVVAQKFEKFIKK